MIVVRIVKTVMVCQTCGIIRFTGIVYKNACPKCGAHFKILPHLLTILPTKIRETQLSGSTAQTLFFKPGSLELIDDYRHLPAINGDEL